MDAKPAAAQPAGAKPADAKAAAAQPAGAKPAAAQPAAAEPAAAEPAAAEPAAVEPAAVEPAGQDPPALANLLPPRPPAQLHQPVRAAVAALEVALAVALGFAVVWAWRRGSVPYELPASENPAVPGSVDRWSGPWIGAAFGLATLAGLLVLDAARQLMLAVRGSWQTAEHDLSGHDL
jgi:hypothetical protein